MDRCLSEFDDYIQKMAVATYNLQSPFIIIEIDWGGGVLCNV
jgi:hypothetical protein